MNLIYSRSDYMPICTTQHYELMAKIIREQPISKMIDQDNLIEVICAVFKDDNPLFDKEKFLSAIKNG